MTVNALTIAQGDRLAGCFISLGHNLTDAESRPYLVLMYLFGEKRIESEAGKVMFFGC